MFAFPGSGRAVLTVLLIMLTVGFSYADVPLDSSRYIGLDEIEPGMTGFTRTVYKGTQIEEFGIEVIDVIRDFRPGQDAILVIGTDPRFIHTGPVAGCSGSPVYIDGRIAGALAFGWQFSKDPLYGVTPIGEMLEVPKFRQQTSPAGGFSFNFAEPLDLQAVYESMPKQLAARNRGFSGAQPLKNPLIMSGVPESVTAELDQMVNSLGLMAVPGPAGRSGDDGEEMEMVAGGVLTIPLVSGDMNFTVVGTITEVVEDQVYGFGHSFEGQGRVELPMAAGRIHTVVSTLPRSFKLGSPGDIVGAVTVDKSAAVYGVIGQEAYTVPMRITIDRFDAPELHQYDTQVVHHRMFTPAMIQIAVSGATAMIGDLPAEHMINYRGTVAVEGFEPIEFSNVSSSGIAQMLSQSASAVSVVMNNPYRELTIERLDFELEVLPERIDASIWSVEVDNTRVEPGGQINVDVLLDAYHGPKSSHRFSLEIPRNVEPGDYQLMVMGARQYEQFLRQVQPGLFMAENVDAMMDALNNLLSIKRNELYCVLALDADGISIERSQLPSLPGTRALVLQDRRRSVRVSPKMRWVGDSVEIPHVVNQQSQIKITVEK